MSGTGMARCREGGCIRDALLHTGFCAPHTKDIRDRRRVTSDGVNLGANQRKLTDAQVEELRRMWAGFRSKAEIARHFKIDAKTVTGVNQTTGASFNDPTAAISGAVVRYSMRFTF